MTEQYLIVTGLPGSGKSRVAEILAERHGFRWIPVLMTRAFRRGEIPGHEKIRVSEEEFTLRLESGRLLHSNETVNLDGSKYYRGIPALEEWSEPLDEDEKRILVCGPRGALKLQSLLPRVTCVFLKASSSTISSRIIGRNGGDYVAGLGEKVLEYQKLGIEKEFEHVVDTEGLGPYTVARMVEEIAGLRSYKPQLNMFLSRP